MKDNNNQQQPPKHNIDFREDSPRAAIPDDEQLSRVALLAGQLQEVERQLSEQEQLLDMLWEKRNELALNAIPAKMEELGLSEFKLKDGSRVTIKALIRASLPTEGSIMKADPELRQALRERFQRGLKYLTGQGAGSLIKNLLKADFGRDSEQQARQALAALRKMGIKASVTKNVHPQTLTAWIRERLESGKRVDMELFAVFAGQQAIITEPTEKI